ncbi:LysR substrate-binding domain-containing protein [Pseudomonas lijiangensis]|uniref:LysR substrate-binding domain-containing protein n=1 Tax=Pseudomonas lijiangensis TaxID=2995658 RepID=UPI0034D58294
MPKGFREYFPGQQLLPRVLKRFPGAAVLAKAASTLAVPLLNALRERHPRVTLYFNEGMGATLHSQLLTGELDLALLYCAHSAPGLAVQVLMHARAEGAKELLASQLGAKSKEVGDAQSEVAAAKL